MKKRLRIYSTENRQGRSIKNSLKINESRRRRGGTARKVQERISLKVQTSDRNDKKEH